MFVFADRISLGFDPTIHHVIGQPEQLVITVHPGQDWEKLRCFFTKSIISLSGAEPLQGQGTCVYKATKLDKSGDEQGTDVVLKDIWINKDHMREGEILTQLYSEAKGEDKGLVQKYFLTTVCVRAGTGLRVYRGSICSARTQLQLMCCTPRHLLSSNFG